jgi:AraC-like DNA-binding protein
MVRAAIADYPAGARMPPRVIDDFEFVWMLQGQARLIDGTGALLLSPGQLLLVPPGVRHSFEWDQARATRHGYVHFRPERETGLPLAQVRLRTMTSHDPLAGLCAYLLWLGQGEDDSWERHATQTLRFLLTMFVSAPLPHDDDPPALAGPLLAAIDHMRRQWSQMPLRRVRVEELAAAAHVSRGYLNRLFRAGFGLSAATALEHARCGRAETLLARTDLTVDAVARQCGFADLYHFSHRFTRIYGMPPSTYRAISVAPSVLDHPGVRRLTRALWE